MEAVLCILRQWQPGIEAATLAAVIIYVWKTWSMAYEMKLSREEMSKPSVMCYFEHNSKVRHYFDFIIKNYGHSMAIDVNLVFSPELQGDFGQRMTNKTFKAMAPGYEWRTLWDSFVRNDPSAPPEYIAKVSYRWGQHRKLEKYEVSFDSMSLSGTKRPHVVMLEDSLQEIAKSVQEIKEALKPGEG